MKRVGEAFRRLAESPQIKAATKVFSQYADASRSQERKQRDETWMEMAETGGPRRRAMLGEVMLEIEEERKEAEFAELRRRYVRNMLGPYRSEEAM